MLAPALLTVLAAELRQGKAFMNRYESNIRKLITAATFVVGTCLIAGPLDAADPHAKDAHGSASHDAHSQDTHSSDSHSKDAGHGPTKSAGTRYVRSEAPVPLPAEGTTAPGQSNDHSGTDHGSASPTGGAHGDAPHAPSTAAATPKAASTQSVPEHNSHGPTGDKTHASTTSHEISADHLEIWADLMIGNRRFVAGRGSERELIKTRSILAAGQHPKVAILACADSRVPPELVFDKNLGELFVVRVAGNLADPAVVGSLEYAVEHLGVKVVVIMGHEKCGAVAAAASGAWMPSPNLHDIVRRIYPAIETAKGAGSADATVQSVANVRNTAAELMKQSPILAKEAGEGHILVVPVIYRLGTGVVDRVDQGTILEAAVSQADGAPAVSGRPAASPHQSASTH